MNLLIFRGNLNHHILEILIKNYYCSFTMHIGACENFY